MDKRYQVFVSSTYADLKEERRAVIQAVIEMDCIPAGMELFPAADEEQFAFIKRLIDDCDYYLLIIGGRYGSTTPDGISYTEKEYDYAVVRRLKVIALIHENPDEIPFGKSEKDPALRERLQRFREKVSTNRLVKFWSSVKDLPGLVALSLANTIKTHPAVGWVRANKAASEELLTEINSLRKQNESLMAEVTELSSEPLVKSLARLDEKFTLCGKYNSRFLNHREDSWNVELTWQEIFAFISPYLAMIPADHYVKSVLTSAAFQRSSRDGYNEHLDDQTFRTVAVQLEALKLVKLTWAEKVGGGYSLFWSITPYGQRLMLKLRTVKSSAAAQAPQDKGAKI